MKKFTASVSRGIRNLGKTKPRGERPSKLRRLNDEIDEGQEELGFSPISEVTTTPGLSPVAENGPGQDNDQQSATASPISWTNAPVPNEKEAPQDDKKSKGQGEVADESLEKPTSSSMLEPDGLTFDQLGRSPPDGSLAKTEEEEAGAAETPEPSTCSQQYDEAQALRQQKYLVFAGEDESDYTEGPVRIIDAFDGIKDSGALLLNLDFSQRIQRAVIAEREFAKSERVVTRQMEVALSFESKIRREISNHQSRLALRDSDEEKSNELEANLQEELQVLESLMRDSQDDRQAMNVRQQDKATLLRAIQSEANAYLEDAFVAARLLEPESGEPDTPIEEKDLQTEYMAYRQAAQEDHGTLTEKDVAPLDLSAAHLAAEPLTEEQQAEQDLKDAYLDAKERLKNARFPFDKRMEDRIMEQAQRDHALKHGYAPLDTTQDEFDTRWFLRVQALTRELSEAEATFDTAKQALLDAGIQFKEPDRESGFLDHASDGYALSEELAMIEAAPKPKIEKWFDNMSSPDSPGFNETVLSEVEQPQEEDTVGVSDSRSVVGVGYGPSEPTGPIALGYSPSMIGDQPLRKRIDKWRETCKLQRCNCSLNRLEYSGAG